MINQFEDTIVALATPPGVGAIAVIRVSGKKAVETVNAVFTGKDLTQQKGHTIHFGNIVDGDTMLDEVLVSLFKGPHSFTKEDAVEISTHGSEYIVKQVIQVLIKQGLRYAKPGEFTQRAFLNGRFDLAQAEAVADLIASDSASSHNAALHQLRGGFSDQIKGLRDKLTHFASMVELELDFGEEDVEFADRDDLKQLVNEILSLITALVESFNYGNAIKNGIPTVIAGKPNAGKSTLLNKLLNEERAIVSEIAGTTRDVIEDEIVIEGMKFRFIDTAGLRDATDAIEKIGVERTRQKMKEASLILYLFDTATETPQDVQQEIKSLEILGIPYIVIGNKVDKGSSSSFEALSKDILFLSAETGEYLENLKEKLLSAVSAKDFKTGNTVVTNARHYESLVNTKQALEAVINGLGMNVTGDFLAMDIRQALHHLGEITGEITTEDLLDNIFRKFCIGK